MASYEVPVGAPAGTRVNDWTCNAGDSYGMGAYTTTLKPVDAAQNIYETGVTGVGIRIRFKTNSGNWSTPLVPPFDQAVRFPLLVLYPNRMLVEFIRTGMDVGRGDILSFDLNTSYYVTTSPVTRYSIIGTQLKTTLVNNIYFTSCYNPASAPTVNLGRPAIGEVKQGNTIQKDFSLDIRCDGMNQTTKPTVSIYFEGNSPRDGLLLTDGQGQAGMAQGVGVALTNTQGVALPFSKAKAMPMTWTSSGVNSEFYHFAGKARYIASGGEIKAGKADATLTYVLQYN